MTPKSPTYNTRIAVFPGTFDPFTIGHYSVVMRALDMFDNIVVAIGINDTKNPCFTVQTRCDIIHKVFANEPRVSVVTYSALTVDVAREIGAKYILRGVRSAQDFEFEKNLADINRNLSGIETVLLYSLPEHAFISSSVVRELLRYGRDVAEFLPPGVKLP